MILSHLRAWSPWSPRDGLRALAVSAVGHGVWAAGWWMATREAAFDRQMPAVNVAVVGFVIVAYADVSWLLRSHHRIVQRRRELLADGAFRPVTVATVDGAVVAGPGLGQYHQPECPFAAGRDWPAVAREMAAEGRLPCGVCRP